MAIGAMQARDRSAAPPAREPRAEPALAAQPDTTATSVSDEQKDQPAAHDAVAEAPKEKTKTARRKPARRKPKPRAEPVDTGNTVILDPWK